MRRSNTQTLGEVLKEYVEAMRMAARIDDINVVKEFKQLMPPLFQKAILSVNYSNGIVFVHMNSAIVRNELMMNKAKIIELVNQRLFNNTLKDIVCR